jgi:hypothetical protein
MTTLAVALPLLVLVLLLFVETDAERAPRSNRR